jgi:hypothetical protein
MLSMKMSQAIRRTVQTIHGFLIEEPSISKPAQGLRPVEQASFF